MKKYLFLLFVSVVVVYLIGCAQKKKEEEFLTMDELGAISMEPATVSELKPEAKTGPIVSEIPPESVPTIPPPPTASSVSDKPAPTASSVSNKPGNREIQTALKNAGYYIGEIDGKIGRITKKAIEDFQEANGLGVDGKVGLQTWSILSKYLTIQAAPVKKKR